jgi:hypothetical protein
MLQIRLSKALADFCSQMPLACPAEHSRSPSNVTRAPNMFRLGQAFPSNQRHQPRCKPAAWGTH